MAKKFSAKNLPKRTIVDIASLERERDRLYVSGEDPERLEEVINTVDYFHFGILPPPEESEDEE